jgi:sugar phosphate isomerase/epimerase
MADGRTDRRNFLKGAGLVLGGAAAAPFLESEDRNTRESKKIRGGARAETGPVPATGLRLGMASYSFRAFELDETIAMTQRLGLTRISLKSMHLPLENTPAQITTAVFKVRSAGIEPYSGGVVYMTNAEEVEGAFAYAKAAGMEMLVGVPNHELLPLVAAMVKKFDLKMAIHNHGPTDKIYPSPESAYEKIKALDRRLGVCIDVGHTQRCGLDPSVSAERCFDRLHDVHIKDVTAATGAGATLEAGRGVVDIPKFLRTLLRLGYAGTVSLEYEKDEKDPLPGAAESIGYFRGVLATLGAKAL